MNIAIRKFSSSITPKAIHPSAVNEILDKLKTKQESYAVFLYRKLIKSKKIYDAAGPNDIRLLGQLFSGFKRTVHPQAPNIVQNILKTISQVSGKNNGEDTRGYLGLAQVNLINGRVEEALPYIDIIENIDKNSCDCLAAYRHLLKYYSSIKDIDAVEATFSEMKNKNIAPNALTYKTLALSYKYANRMDKLKKLAKIIDEDGNVELDTFLYNILILACIPNDKDQAIEYFKKMKEQGIKPDNETYAGIVRIIANDKSKSMYYAQDLLKEIRYSNIDTGFSAEIYRHMIHGYLVRQEFSNADIFLRKFLHVFGLTEDAVKKPNFAKLHKDQPFSLYRTLIVYYRSLKLYDLGSALIKHMDSLNIIAPIYSHYSILDILLSSGEVELARQKFFTFLNQKNVQSTVMYDDRDAETYSKMAYLVMQKSSEESVDSMESVMKEWKRFSDLTSRLWDGRLYGVAIAKYNSEKLYCKMALMWNDMSKHYFVKDDMYLSLTKLIAEIPLDAVTATSEEKLFLADAISRAAPMAESIKQENQVL